MCRGIPPLTGQHPLGIRAEMLQSSRIWSSSPQPDNMLHLYWVQRIAETIKTLKRTNTKTHSNCGNYQTKSKKIKVSVDSLIMRKLFCNKTYSSRNAISWLFIGINCALQNTANTYRIMLFTLLDQPDSYLSLLSHQLYIKIYWKWLELITIMVLQST